MDTQWVTGKIVSYLTWRGYSVGHWDDSKLFNWHGHSEGHWDDSRLFNLAWVLRGSLG